MRKSKFSEHNDVKIVTAFQVPVTPTPEVWALPAEYFETIERTARESAQAVVDRAVAKLRDALDKSVTVTGEVLAGPPRDPFWTRPIAGKPI